LNFPEFPFLPGEEPQSFPDEDGVSYIDRPSSDNPWAPTEDVQECPALGDEELKNKADSAFKADERKMSTGEAKAIGNPILIAGAVIEMRGLDEALNGNWTVEKVVHEVAPAPYLMSLSMRRKAVSRGDDIGCEPGEGGGEENDDPADDNPKELVSYIVIDGDTQEVEVVYIDESIESLVE